MGPPEAAEEKKQCCAECAPQREAGEGVQGRARPAEGGHGVLPGFEWLYPRNAQADKEWAVDTFRAQRA